MQKRNRLEKGAPDNPTRLLSFCVYAKAVCSRRKKVTSTQLSSVFVYAIFLLFHSKFDIDVYQQALLHLSFCVRVWMWAWKCVCTVKTSPLLEKTRFSFHCNNTCMRVKVYAGHPVVICSQRGSEVPAVNQVWGHKKAKREKILL